MRMPPVHDDVDTIEPSFEESLITLEFERVRHDSCRIRKHAVRGDNRVSFDAARNFHRLIGLPSGKLTKISAPRITVAMRAAASCPFQTFDCHMAKYSPAITMKPKNQRPKPTVNPATAQTFERLKTSAAPGAD